jgi:hypothetical protein
MDFYLTLLRSTPEIVRPHVLAVYRGGLPTTILVGRLDPRPIERLRVGYLPIKLRANSLFFVNGSLRGHASPQDSELLIGELCKNLQNGEADLAYLTYLRDDSHLYDCAMKLPPYLCRDRVGKSQLHFTATIPKTMNEFYERLSPKTRKNKKWEAKKIATEFSNAIQIRQFKDPAEVDLLAETAEQIAATSYQRGLGVGFFDNPEQRTRLRQKAEKQWLSAHILYLGGKACAFWIGDITDGAFGSDYLGFDPKYGKYSPGVYLILRVIDSFCSESPRRVERIDFGTGAAQYKELLSDDVYNEVEVYIFAPSFKGATFNLVKTLATSADIVAKRALERAGLLKKIKKAWRGRVEHSHGAAKL